ncbi:hypothetical protein B0T21DRAFT_435292 [Apiosordaria backusii]|uniref:VOC domain-containing protein n=1 Tax=Apiosordaria backusii TaxID=314023 RepID=A0AA39ZP75_9PEZI|nr:hypothetical protein B0T21DRAFT_435292 [Apiosordaria backusii]
MATAEKLVSPASIGHFGIRTTPEKFEAMVKWHLDFFGGHEHHRMVIVQDNSHEQIPRKKHPRAATVYHIAFTLNSLKDLATSYEQKKARGILPYWPVNHGMSTSMYYIDPDGNEFEMQYATNPIGVDIAIDEWLARVKGGEDEKLLKKRPQIGQQLSRYENSIYFKKPVETA